MKSPGWVGSTVVIQPLANLVPSEEHRVYGIVATTTHEELSRLYAFAESNLGASYLPEAVLVETLRGGRRPALCYIAPSMELKPATHDYIDRIVNAATEYGFPTWYVARVEGFRPAP